VTDDADRDQPGLGLMSEDNLARRVAWEMNQRGWSQERMAKEMTDAGFPLHQSSVSKIVNPKDGKRRAISVDDAIGFARVFGVTVEDLLIPLEAVFDTGIRDTLIRLEKLHQQREDLDREAAALATRLVQYAHAAGPDAVDRNLAGTDHHRVLEELHRWGQRLMEQVNTGALDGLSDDEARDRLRRITLGEQYAAGGQR